MSEKIGKNQNKWQKIIFVALGGTLGVALLVYGNATADKKEAEAAAMMTENAELDADAYAAMLEERVRSICQCIDGAGEVEVFVSLRGGYRTVYAQDSQSGNSGYKNEIVMSGSGSDKKAVVTAYENPEIAGVGIVCSGAGNERVRTQIISLVCASLNIGANKIFVATSG